MKRITTTIALVLLLSWVFEGGRVKAADGVQDSAVTIVAVGDTACDPTNSHFNGGQGDATWCQEKATSDLAMNEHAAAVLALGDNQYEDATLAQFMDSYQPTWGRMLAITHPVLGNHEYQTPHAAGHFSYFGSLAGKAPGGYYSFDVGGWHMIALNSVCAEIGGCGPGSQQEAWLLADLAAHRNLCSLAFWHYPRFTSGRNLNHPELQTLWQDLYAHGADIVLNGHDHIYERFAPQNPLQTADPAHGIREFIVGTGGNNHQPNFGVIQPNSELRDNKTYGVLRLVLHKDSYEWKFLPSQQTGNGKLTDSGTGTCHSAPTGVESSNGPRAVPVVASDGVGTISRFTVNFESTKAGQGYVLFGPGPGCSGLVMTATGDYGSGTTHHWFVVTGNDLPSMFGDTSLTPGTQYWYEVVTQTGSGTEVDNNAGKCYSVTVPAGSG